MDEHQRIQAERNAIEKIRKAYACLNNTSERDVGHARVLCLDAIDSLEIALGIDDESQLLRRWDQRFKNQ